MKSTSLFYQAPRDMILVVYLGLPLSLKCHFGPSLPAEKYEKLACKMRDITEQNSSTKRWWNSMLSLMEHRILESVLNWREGDSEAEVSESETFGPLSARLFFA